MFCISSLFSAEKRNLGNHKNTRYLREVIVKDGVGLSIIPTSKCPRAGLSLIICPSVSGVILTSANTNNIIPRRQRSESQCVKIEQA